MDKVNSSIYLTGHKPAYNFVYMKYGERLKKAREHASLSQEQLAELADIKQPSISYLENPNNNPEGSEHTARFARICKVSVDWLSDEIGEMVPLIYSTSDPKIIAVIQLMEPLPDFGKAAAIKSITEIEELIASAKKNGNRTAS